MTILDKNLPGSRTAMRGIEFGAAYPIISKSTQKSLPVVLKSVLAGSSATTETYNLTYINVNGTVQNQFSVRSGFYYHKNNWDEKDITIGNKSFFVMDGDVIATGFYSGVSLINRKHLVIETEEYGLSSKSAHTQLYFDIILASTPSLGSWTDSTGQVGTAMKEYNLNKETNLETAGFGTRLGWIYNTAKPKGNGWYFKLETGIRPGLKGKGFFFIGAFGIAINKG